jgi:hypothetical protein
LISFIFYLFLLVDGDDMGNSELVGHMIKFERWFNTRHPDDYTVSNKIYAAEIIEYTGHLMESLKHLEKELDQIPEIFRMVANTNGFVTFNQKRIVIIKQISEVIHALEYYQKLNIPPLIDVRMINTLRPQFKDKHERIMKIISEIGNAVGDLDKFAETLVTIKKGIDKYIDGIAEKIN